jgi:hypothetical protein
LARKLYPNDTVSQKAWITIHQKRLLDKGKLEKLVLSLRSTESTNADVLDKIRTEATTSSDMPNVCVTRSSAVSTCSLALV